jgi:hypothetical protein
MKEIGDTPILWTIIKCKVIGNASSLPATSSLLEKFLAINCSPHPCFPYVDCNNERGATKVEIDGHL